MNPLAALYFAVEGEPARCSNRRKCEYCDVDRQHDSVVHCLFNDDAFTIEGLANQETNGVAPYYTFGDGKVGVLRPPHISPRIAAQGSLLTISSAPANPIQPDESFKIGHADRDELRRQLHRLGINRRTLFPDMDGVATHLKWSFSPDVGTFRD